MQLEGLKSNSLQQGQLEALAHKEHTLSESTLVLGSLLAEAEPQVEVQAPCMGLEEEGIDLGTDLQGKSLHMGFVDRACSLVLDQTFIQQPDYLQSRTKMMKMTD